MDWDKAIEAHLKWKTRLRYFIDGTATENLASSTVASDTSCDLGKWIAESGREHCGEPDFEKMKSEHAHFHRAAGAIVELVEKNQRDAAAEKLTDSLGEFSRVSTRVVMNIRRFRNHLVG